MAENTQKSYEGQWLLRYIVTAETSAIVLGVIFYMTGFQDLVTKDELKSLPYPYMPDKAVITQHIKTSEKAFSRISKSVHVLNERMTQQRHEQDLRIQLLELDLRRRNNGK